MNSYLMLSNNTYYELEKYQETFSLEAKILEKFKCLILKEEINDFYIEGNEIKVFKEDDKYYLSFNNQVLEVLVKDKMIFDFKLIK